MKRLAITTGDPDGIGFEVTVKALKAIGPKSTHQILVWHHPDSTQKFTAALRKKFDFIQVSSLNEALKIKPRPRQLVEINEKSPPAEWVKQAAQAALAKKIDALCTGPLSKTSPGAGGGHTGIFRKLVDRPLYMFFLGSKFNVLLLTDHIPLSQVGFTLTKDRIENGIVLTHQFLKTHFKSKAKLPLGVLGLNPHAGENGLLGTEESSLLIPALQTFNKTANSKALKLEGPLVPDAAFLPANWKRYSAYIAPYHDQGLIPFKMVHGHGCGVHLTLGLPFVRTSVDHGTAKELFGQNKADPGSMIEAIKWAVKLSAAPNSSLKRN